MEYVVLLIVVVVVAAFFMNRGRDFDDPKPMPNQQLLAAIAGQADWLEKMSRAPIESQNSPSIIEITKKRSSNVKPQSDAPLQPPR